MAWCRAMSEVAREASPVALRLWQGDNLAVLERLATDGDSKLAGEIDRLRDGRRV